MTLDVRYDGAHSITIGELTTEQKSGGTYTTIEGHNTWKDWHLIPASRPVVNPPPPNTKDFTVPGRNGKIDISTILTGYMTYQNRTGSWDFIVDHNQWHSWEAAYTCIMGHIHGESLKCILDDDPGYYYEGLFSVSGWKSDKDWSTITINYDLYPYKKDLQTSMEPWLWDPFSFETGVIREYGTWSNGVYHEYRTIAANSSETIEVAYIGEERVIPEIYSNSSYVTLTAFGHTYNLTSGTKKYRGLRLIDNRGTENFVFTNNGSSAARVGVFYRGGEF